MINAIPDEFREFVATGIECGRFRNEQEAISAGLSLLREHDRRLDALKADLQIGIDQLDHGERVALDAADIAERGRLRRDKSKA